MHRAAAFIGIVSVFALAACSSQTDKQSDPQAYILSPGEGEDTVGDGSSITKASPLSGTQGAVFVEDVMVPSGTSGIHKHLKADELFYVIDGVGSMFLGNEEQQITEGDFIFVPAGKDHRITSSEESPLHVIYVLDRPGLDEQFRAEMKGLDRTQMSLDEFNERVRKYGTEYKSFD